MLSAVPTARESLRANDHGWILDAARAFAASGAPWRMPVSIVIPVYDRKSLLARTLAALTHQSYPRELLQVVIADDGSRDGVEELAARYARVFDLVHVRQEDRGFRLAEVRNRATRAARHDAIILIDADVIPPPGHVESFMRILHVTDRAIGLGMRRFVDADGLDEAAVRADPEAVLRLPPLSGPAARRRAFVRDGVAVDWREDVLAATDGLRRSPDPWRCVVGANLAYPRAFVEEVGGYCEDFRAWGREDTEFGHRLFDAGKYFVPVPGALGLHQEPPGAPDPAPARAAGLAVTDPLFIEKCPLHPRRTDRARRHEVPLLDVVVPPGAPPAAVERTVASVRRQTLRDLELVVCGAEGEDAAVARGRGSLVARLPAGMEPEPDALGRLAEALLAREHGCIAHGPDVPRLLRAWDAGDAGAVGALLDRHLLLFRRRDRSRACWLADGVPGAHLQLPRVTGLHPAPAGARRAEAAPAGATFQGAPASKGP